MWGQLGDIQFSGLLGFTTIDQGGETDYAEHALLDGKPRLQKIGSKLDTVKAAIYLHASFVAPSDVLNRLVDYRTTGEILPLITGAGEVVGNFILKATTIKRETTDGEGRIISATIELDLLEISTPELTAPQSGFAMSTASPATVTPPLTQQESLSSIAAANVTIAGVESTSVLSGITAANISNDTAGAQAGTIQAAAVGINTAMAAIDAAINFETSGALYDATRDLDTYLPTVTGKADDIIAAALDLKGYADAEDAVNVVATMVILTTLGGELDLITRQLRAYSSPLVAFYICRR